MRERPTVAAAPSGTGLRPRPRSRCSIGPWLAAGTQVVYLDQRGAGRSDAGRPEDLRLERWADDVREFCDALRIERPVVLGLGFGSLVALDYAARYPEHPGALVLIAPVARIVPERSIRGLRAARRRGGGRGRARATTARWTSRSVRRLRARLLPAALELRPDERRDRARPLAPGGADGLDARRGEGGRRARAARRRPGAGARARGRGRRLGAARVGRGRSSVCLGSPTRFRSFPGARHSVLQDAPAAYEELRLFLDDVQDAQAA